MIHKIIIAFFSLSICGGITLAYTLDEAIQDAQSGAGINIGTTYPENLPGVNESSESAVSKITGSIQGISNALAAIAAGVAVLFCAINGAQMAFSAGDTEKLTKSKKGLTWSVIGLLLIIFSYIIAKTVIWLTYSADL